MSDLIQDWADDRYGEAGALHLPRFDATVEVYNWDGASRSYAEACARHAVGLSGDLLDRLVAATVRYRTEFLDDIGEEAPPLNTPHDVLAEVHPVTLMVPNPGDRTEPVVHLEANCDWEPEHGLEWVVRGDTVVYVGPYEGWSPWIEGTSDQSY